MTLTDELVQYCDDVIAGNIIACKKHIWACERFKGDLANQGKNTFPYFFDEERAQKFLKWMGFFLHRKGPLAGTKKEPVLIEKFVFGNIYGWFHRDTGRRRFRKAYWQVARKNSKSQDLGLLGLYELAARGESSAEVYCAATKKQQAKIVWDEANWMYKNCSYLRGKIKTAYGEITHPKSGSVFRPLSKDDKESGDGLNPQCGIIDEYHAHKTSEYYDILVSGMAARLDPLMMIITTAGFDLNHPCYRVEYQYVSKILDPNIDIHNEEYFVMINELDRDDEGNLVDDIKDETSWKKANPLVCLTENGLSYLRGELKSAIDEPEKMRNFLTKNMNVWINDREKGYMNMEKWKVCGASKQNPWPDLDGAIVLVGNDMSATIDLTSVSFVFPLADGMYAVMSHSFMPEETLFRKRKTDRVPYDLWLKQGWISATPGAEVDHRFVMDYIEKQAQANRWQVKEVCFDKWNAVQFSHDMAERGFTMVDIIQGIKTLGEPTKKFRAAVYNQKVIHNNNPVLTWAISNAIIRQDHNENIMLDKAKSTERIDPIAAVLNAFVRAISAEESVKKIILTL